MDVVTCYAPQWRRVPKPTPRWWDRRFRMKSRDGELETISLLEVVESQADHVMEHVVEIRKAPGPPSGGGMRAA